MSTKGSNTTTQNTNQTSTNAYYPSAASMAQWGNIEGTAQGLWQAYMNNPPQYTGQAVAAPGQLTNNYWNQAGAGISQPDYSGLVGSLANLYNTAGGQTVNPQSISLPSNYNFQPGNLPTGYSQQNVFQTASPVWVSAPGQGGTGPYASTGPAVSGLASNYYVQPNQVTAPTVQAPGGISQVSGLGVYGPQLQQYQMYPAQQVGAQSVSPQAQVSTQSWTDPGMAAQFMSPYTQQVVNAQLAQAQTQEQQQLEQQSAQAAQAGAFGGSRQAVEAANTSIGYQQLAAQLEATGLQNAYQQGQQQFNTQQALGLQGQQFNVQTGLTAQQLNQQAGLQAALANQSAGLTVGQQNLAALLGVQQLGAQQNLQSQLANQQTGLSAALANQQAQEFTAGQQLQAGLANAGYNMSAQQLNQQAGLQAGLAAQQMGLQGAQFTAGQAQQAALANQAAAMQSLGLQYQGGLQAALANQQLGMQGQIYGGQLGLQSAAQQAQLQQAQQGYNLSALGQQAGLASNIANLGQLGVSNQIAGLAAMAAPAQSQQGYLQQLADTAYQQWLQQNMYPFQATSYAAQLLGMQPLPYNTTGTTTGTTALTTPAPSLLSQILGGAATLAGVAGNLGWTPFGARGGLMQNGGFRSSGEEPRRFQYGGYDMGISTPHYPQPIMPPAAPVPDLLSRYHPPQRQSLLATLSGDLTQKDSGLAKILGPLFKKKKSANDTTPPTDTTNTSAPTPAPSDTSSVSLPPEGGLVTGAPSTPQPGDQTPAPPGQSPEVPAGSNMDAATWSYVRQGYPLDQARQMAAISGPNPFYSWETPSAGWNPRPAPSPSDLGYRSGGIAHSDAPADRRQILQILREKGLTKAQGGTIQMKRRHFVPRPKGAPLEGPTGITTRRPGGIASLAA